MSRYHISALISAAAIVAAAGASAGAAPPTQPSGPMSPMSANDFFRPCDPVKDTELELVFLLDQSTSLLQSDPQNKRKDGLSAVVENLAVAQSSADVIPLSVGVITFATDSAVIRPLEPFTPDMVEAFTGNGGVVDRATSNASLGEYTDYVKGLSAALDMLAPTSSNTTCQVVLWFTDGEYDIPGGTFAEEATALETSICTSDGLAARSRTLGVRIYTLLLASGTATTAPDPDKQLRHDMSLLAAMAMSGDPEPEFPGDEPLPKVDEPCRTFVNDRNGEVLGADDAAAVAAQLLVLLTSVVDRAEQVVSRCPVALVDENTTVPLPAGQLIEEVKVVTLTGAVTGFQSSASSEPIPVTGAGLQVAFPADALAQQPAGWKLTVIGEPGTEVCITATPERDLRIDLQHDLTRPWTSSDQPIELTTSSDLGVTTCQLRSKEFLPVAAATGSCTFGVTPRITRNTRTIDRVDLLISPSGTTLFSDGLVATGRLTPPIEVEPDANLPELACVDAALRLTDADVPREPIAMAGRCTLTSALKNDTQLVLSTDLSPDDLAATGMTALLDGEPVGFGQSIVIAPNTGDHDLSFTTSGELPNEALGVNGRFTIAATWQEIDLPGQNVDVLLDLRARPDLGDSLLYALAITAICGLLSLLLLRGLNALFVHMPDPSDFYQLTAPVVIERAPSGHWMWADRDRFRPSTTDLRPAGGDRDDAIQMGGITLRRRLGPLLRPFKAPYVDIDGAAVAVANPSGARAGTVPIGFQRLVVVHTPDGEVFDALTGRIDASATMLLPKREGLSPLDAVRADIESLCTQLAARFEGSTAGPAATSGPEPDWGPPPLFSAPTDRVALRPEVRPAPPAQRPPIDDEPPPFL
jgi:hypothetical protein